MNTTRFFSPVFEPVGTGALRVIIDQGGISTKRSKRASQVGSNGGFTTPPFHIDNCYTLHAYLTGLLKTVIPVLENTQDPPCFIYYQV